MEEAVRGPESDKWKKVMEAEMGSIASNNVWTLAEPADRQPISCKWVFKKKIGPDGFVCSYKARLVAQGFSQKIGLDYDETFSPAVRFESICTILSLAAQHNLNMPHMDVSSAFLNGKLSEELYMKQPEGFTEEGNEHLVCKLNKALYGQKQAPKCWNSSLDSFLKELQFEQSKSDSCIYTRIKDDVLCIMGVCVDGLIITCTSLAQLNEVKSSLSARYKMKHLGQLTHFLGVNIVQEDGKIFINQSAYAKSSIKKVGSENANSC